MKPFIFYAVCCTILLSCKKENTTPQPVENSHQQLTKITSTGEFGGGSYSVEYQFNSAGKIVKEGNTIYERDAQQRVIKIVEASTILNGMLIDGRETKVYYNSKASNQVDYTLWGTDSTTYIHDDNGRLIKTMSYLKGDAPPGTISLTEYYFFTYNAEGNIVSIDRFVINYDGKTTHCSHNEFGKYDYKINSLYTEDEVRVAESACGGMLNSSKNNFTYGNGYTKTYEYRTDGRPRNCIVQLSGKNVVKLVYEYK